jgi:hypothetical protein
LTDLKSSLQRDFDYSPMEIRFALFALPLLAIPIPDPEFPTLAKYAAAFAFASAVLGSLPFSLQRAEQSLNLFLPPLQK